MKNGSWFALGVAAVAALLVVWWSWRGADEASPVVTPLVAPEPEGEVVEPPPPPPPGPVEREQVSRPVENGSPPAAEPTADEEPFDPSPVQVDPWLLRLLVVDGDDQPVAGAVVTIWAAKKARSDFARLTGQKGNAYSGHEPEPLLELPTDGTGRTQAKLELECIVAAASKDGVGRSGELMLWHTRAAEAETKIVIESSITLRGVVLRADGLPAVGAEVSVHVNGMSTLTVGRQAPQPDPVTTGADGRFAVPVQKGFGYGLHGELNGERTFAESVWVQTAMPAEVVLTFPGAITLSGVVVDADGVAVAGAGVRGWREYDLRAARGLGEDYEHVQADTDGEGRFSVSVKRHMRYQLIASSDGHAPNEPVWVEPTPGRPHATARLQLLRFDTIEGRVVRGDGSPFPGVRVVARAETGERVVSLAVPRQQDRFGQPDVATTADDGGFAFTVHPGTTWTLVALPDAENNRLQVEVTGIAPGRKDVELRITDADLAGCVVRGTVVRADGQPIGHYKVDVLTYEDGKPRGGGPAKAEFDGNRFTLAPLPLGQTVALRVTPKDNEAPHARNSGPCAPAQVGPFTTDRAELAFEFRLENWGEVPARVFAADGTPARKVRVAVAPDVNVGFHPAAMPVDDDGRIVLKRCVAGAATLRVFDDGTQLHEQELHVTPGPNPEVVVRLP